MKGKIFNPKQVQQGEHLLFAKSCKHASIIEYPNGFVKVYTTKEKPLEAVKRERERKAKYMKECKELTEKNALSLEITNRGFYKDQIDHIVPRSDGYKHNIPTQLIASIENLQILSRNENYKKGDKLTDKANELLAKWGF